MRIAIPGTVAAVLLSLATALSAAPAVQDGTWSAVEDDAGRLHLTVTFGSTIWSRAFDRPELQGISDGEIASRTSAPVSFRAHREAGVFEFRGAFRESSGSGHFAFQPSDAFARTLRSLGIEGADRVAGGDLLLLALGRASAAQIRELTGLGLGTLDTREVVELGLHGVTAEYVRSLRSVGLPGTHAVARLVEMRTHRLTAAYVRELESLGYGGLPYPQLLQMSIHGVDGEQIRELARAGYEKLPPQQLVDMRIHRVTPAFIREMRAAGVRDLSPGALIQARIHGIAPASGRATTRTH